MLDCCSSAVGIQSEIYDLRFLIFEMGSAVRLNVFGNPCRVPHEICTGQAVAAKERSITDGGDVFGNGDDKIS